LQLVDGFKGFYSKLCGGGGVHYASHVSKSAAQKILSMVEVRSMVYELRKFQ